MKRKEILNRIMVLLLTLVFTVQFTGVFSEAFAIEDSSGAVPTSAEAAEAMSKSGDNDDNIGDTFDESAEDAGDETAVTDADITEGADIAAAQDDAAPEDPASDDPSESVAEDAPADAADEDADAAELKSVRRKSVLRSAASTKKTIKITKIWEDDEESVRPDPSAVIMNIKRSASYLIQGTALEDKMKKLSGSGDTNNNNDTIQAIKQATKDQYEAKKSDLTSNNEVQEAGEKTYMWFEDNTIYYYSEAGTIYLNENSGGTFRKMKNLTDISGLAGFNTYYVNDMNRLFQDSTSLADLDPISGWDVSHVTDLTFAFGAIYTEATNLEYMSIDSLAPLADWDVSNVSSFNQAFKACNQIKTLEPIADWNVSRLENVNQMFNRCTGLNDTTRDYIKGWDVSCISSWSMMFQNQGTINNPIFEQRQGRWDKGTYVPYDSAKSPSPHDTVSLPSSWDEVFESTDDSVCSVTDNGDNTWTYTFSVPNDGGSWNVWESTTDGKHLADKDGRVDAYTESSDGMDGLGGSEDNPITGVTDSATITNTLLKYELTVSKNVTGNTADKTKAFDFTFTTGATGSFDYKIVEGANEKETGNISSGGAFSLKDGESIEIAGIPHGSTYEIVETNYSSAGYTTSTSGDAASGTMDAAKSITFTNSKNGVVPTGMITKMTQWLVMAAMPLLGLIAYLIMLIRRRKYAEEL